MTRCFALFGPRALFRQSLAGPSRFALFGRACFSLQRRFTPGRLVLRPFCSGLLSGCSPGPAPGSVGSKSRLAFAETFRAAPFRFSVRSADLRCGRKFSQFYTLCVRKLWAYSKNPGVRALVYTGCATVTEFETENVETVNAWDDTRKQTILWFRL